MPGINSGYLKVQINAKFSFSTFSSIYLLILASFFTVTCFALVIQIIYDYFYVKKLMGLKNQDKPDKKVLYL